MTQGAPGASAVVFAYHDVGVRCLSALLARGLRVPLVVTHRDDPAERVWFASVEALAGAHGIPVAVPEEPNRPELAERVRALAPDFVFSFYYRHMLGRELLAAARRGALNVHGSLLPRYRGRAPVNWAVIRGETQTGATLHYMTEEPDAGAIVDRQAVPILPDDTAFEVMKKVTWAAELVLWRSLPALVAGTARAVPQDASLASYFGRRRPEDGVIDWRLDAAAIHNLVRGVAPPYPGAFTALEGRPMRILKTRLEPARRPRSATPVLYGDGEGCYADCGGSGVLRLLEFELDGEPIAPERYLAGFGPSPRVFA